MSQVNSVNGNTLLFTGFFPPCRAATTGSAITLAGLQTLDGIALNAGDRVLVKDQADQTTNGIYAVNSGNWVRTSDALSSAQFYDGMSVVVSQGTQNAATIFICTTTDDPVIIGTSLLTFLSLSTINTISAAMRPVVQAATLSAAYAAFALVSPALIPVTQAATLIAAQALLGIGWGNRPNPQTAAYGVVNGDKNSTISFAGNALYTVSFGAAAGYDANFTALLYNADSGRGKLISIPGISNFILWPLQSVFVFSSGGAWQINPRFQRWQPGANVTFFVDTAGSDANDGLATGTGALRNIATAVNMTQHFVDWGGTNSGFAGTVSPTAGQTFTETVAVSGAQIGSNEIFIQGNGGAFNWANSGQNSMLSVGDGGICIIQNINFLSTNNTFGKASIYLHNNAIVDINAGITVTGGGSNDIAVFLDNHCCICTLANGLTVTNTLKAVIWCDTGGKVSLSGALAPTGATQVSQLLQAQYRSVIIVGTQPATSGWGSIGTSNAILGGLINTNGTSIPGGTSSATGGLVI